MLLKLSQNKCGGQNHFTTDFLFFHSIGLFCFLLLIVALSGFGLEQQLSYKVNLMALCWATRLKKDQLLKLED